MRTETRTAMEKLFSASWNIPKAAEHCGLTNKECKIVFNEYTVNYQHSHPTDSVIMIIPELIASC
jgi:hypothetical protein